MPAKLKRPRFVLDETPPTVPLNLSASPAGATAVTISWAASFDAVGVTGYIVRRDGIQVGTPTVTTFADTGLTEATDYSYTVEARDAAGNVSGESVALVVTTADVSPPTVPSGLAASAITATSLTLTWLEPSDNTGVTGYSVKRNGSVIAAPTVTTLNQTGLSEATSYSYEVAAHDAVPNLSAYSPPLVVTTLDITAPTKPANLTATDVTGNGLTLEWDPSTDNVGVAYYEVIRDFATIGSTPDPTFAEDDLEDATLYNYAVRAVDAAGNTSAYSDAVSVTTLDVTAPSVPTNLAASSITTTTLHLAWSASTDNVSVAGYVIYRDGTQIATPSGTSYDDSGLDPDTTYLYKVAARDAAGNISPPSQQLTVTTTPQSTTLLPFFAGDFRSDFGSGGSGIDTVPPTTPSSLTLDTNSTTSVTFHWTASTDAESGIRYYIVYRGGVQLRTTTATNSSDATVAPSTSYAYTIKALDHAGNLSAASNTLNVTTPGVGGVVFTPEQLLSGTSSVLVPNNTTVDNAASMAVMVGRAKSKVTAVGPITIDFGGKFYNCENTVNFPDAHDITLLGPGGLTAVTDDGPYAYGSTKARTRCHLKLSRCDSMAVVDFEVNGPFSFAQAYDVKREGQAAIWLEGSTNVLVQDTILHNVWGDALYMGQGSSPTGTNDLYNGNIEALGGHWYDLNRTFVAMWACRAPDAIDPGAEQTNPGDASLNDAPSASGLQYGFWWHGNAAHPFVAENCKRTCFDIEPILSYRHCCDIRVGADDAANNNHFVIQGSAGNTLQIGNGWALVNRLTMQHLKRIGAPDINIVGGPLDGNNDGVITAPQDPARAKYTMKDITIDSNVWTLKPVSGRFMSIRRVTNLTITNNTAIYRQGIQTPLASDEIVDDPNFDKGGTSQFGNNTFVPG